MYDLTNPASCGGLIPICAEQTIVPPALTMYKKYKHMYAYIEHLLYKLKKAVANPIKNACRLCLMFQNVAHCEATFEPSCFGLAK